LELRPLYDALDRLCSQAHDDVRKFSGFKKKWNPDVSTLKPKDA
jgi:hypothetical protein